MKAAAILVGDDGIEPPQVESESTALPLCKSPMTFAWSNKCSQQLFIIAAECVFVNRFFKIFAKIRKALRKFLQGWLWHMDPSENSRAGRNI